VKTIVVARIAIAVAVIATSLITQPKPAPQKVAQAVPAIEFPVQMQQNVTAGKTAVGTRVHAKLVIATLVKGKVIPEGAILLGEVTESVAKSATLPSRLGILMDSAQWKNGSAPIKAYLTAWYYPVTMPNPDAMGGPTASTPSGAGASKLTRNRDPSAQPSFDQGPEPLPESNDSGHRVLMKDVESTRSSEGAVTLSSSRSTLKLDKATTYVFAADGLAPAR